MDSDSEDEDWEESGNPYEDHSFPGALGFGAGGDICLYQHAATLSAPCRQAVVDLHGLREDFWQQHVETTYPHHHHGLGLLLAGAALLWLLRRALGYKRRRAVQDLLQGLQADPELKASVEGRLGLAVPAARIPCRAASCCSRLLLTLALLFFALAASFFISITSLELTSAVVQHLDASSPQPASPGLALLILFAFCTLQVTLLAYAIRQAKLLYLKYYGGNGTVHSSPSAPPASGASSSGPRRATAVQHPGLTFVPVSLQNWVAPRVFGRRGAPEGYAPLAAQEESTEMIAVGSAYKQPSSSSSAPQAHYAVFAEAPLVPITAMPVNSVNFV